MGWVRWLACAVGIAAVGIGCLASQADADLYWTQDANNYDGFGGTYSSVWRSYLNGADSRVVGEDLETPAAAGVAADSQYYYFTTMGAGGLDYIPGTVGRFSLTGGGLDADFINPDAGAGGPTNIAESGSYLYVSGVGVDSNEIGRANLDGSGMDYSFITGLGYPTDVAANSQYVYWTDAGDNTVGRANIDASGVDPALISGVDDPGALAINSQYVYWTNSVSNTIGRANLDGTGVNEKFITGADQPEGVAVSGQYIYWTNEAGDSIGRANLNGTGVDQSFMTGLTDPLNPALPGNPWNLAIVPDPPAPTASIATPVNGSTHAVGEVVDASYTCADGAGGPGVTSCTGTVPSGTALKTTTPGTYTFTVTATSGDGQTGTASATYTVAAAPTASIKTPVAGKTYAAGQVIAESFTCSDGTDGPGIAACIDQNGAVSGTALNTTTTGMHTLKVTATSKDGQTGSTSVTYDVAAAPSASIAAPMAGKVFTVGQAADDSFTCSEGAGGTGIATCLDQNGNPSGAALNTSTPGSHTLTVSATSKDGLTGTANVAYTVAAAPTVSIASPPSGTTYLVGHPVNEIFSCSDGAGGPGIATCLDQNGKPSGAALDTSTPGSHALTVMATSKDGQTATATVTYDVTVAPGVGIVAPVAGETFAVGQVVDEDFACGEGAGGPGLLSCVDQNGNPSGTALNTSATGVYALTVTATSKDGLTGDAKVTYTVAAAPTASITAPVTGATLAVGSAVDQSFSCSEGADGPGIATCLDQNGNPSGTALDTTTTGPHTLTVTATSSDGQTATTSVAYTVRLAPTATIAAPLSGATYAVGQVVDTSFTCTDGFGGPGIASCTGAVSNGAALDTSTPGAHSFSVEATSDDGLAGEATVSYTVAGAPTVSIGAPADGATYTVGQAVEATFSCADGAGGPGIATCVDQSGNPSGTPLNTATAGSHAVTVTATSADGQSATATVTYTVVAASSGSGSTGSTGSGSGSTGSGSGSAPVTSGSGGSPTTASTTAPVLSGLRQSHLRWREGRGLARVTGTRAAVGTTFTFTLEQRASIRLVFTERVPGRSSTVRGKNACAAPTTRNEGRPRCSRTVTAGSLSLKALDGAERLVFDGRTSATQALAPGTYIVTFIAKNAAGLSSKPQSLRFTILK